MKKGNDDGHFNPFSAEVAELLIKSFEKRDLTSLPPENVGMGCGVYGLYYFGDHKAYKKLNLKHAIPIYIGKAVMPGGRKGAGDSSKTNRIIKRLNEHSKSITQTTTLSLEDFKCRWLSVDPHFVGTAESILIDHFKPAWNSLISGFGIHKPGKGRDKQACSDWDSLHPGRKLALGLPKGNSIEEIIKRIEQSTSVKKLVKK